MHTERRNPRSVDIDLFPTERILRIINEEDASVASAVGTAIPDIAKVTELAVETIKSGGHVIYVGAGTSGRIAALDAAECPSTFSAPPEWIQFVLAGGSKAFVRAVDGSEDEREQAAADMKPKKLSKNDLVIGIAASGATPYTMAGLEFAKRKGSKTAALVCVPNSAMSKIADITICIVVGPEVISGSTRMKAGTAQKMALNMISTATMIRLGMTYSNWMINVSMANRKLSQRGIHMLQEILGVPADEAERLVEASGSKLKVAVVMGATGCSREVAEERLSETDGNLRKVLGHLGTGRE